MDDMVTRKLCRGCFPDDANYNDLIERGAHSYYTKEIRFRESHDTFDRIWICTNCRAETPRRVTHRRTNDRRALDIHIELTEQWKAVNAWLHTPGVKGYYLYSSYHSYHMRMLDKFSTLRKDKPKLNNFDIKWHVAGAREDLAKAIEWMKTERGYL